MQFVARFVLFVFGLIGVLVIAFLWMVDGLYGLPIFFKLFGTLVASVLCVVGLSGAFFGPGRFGSALGRKAPKVTQGNGGYTCPHCQGGLEAKIDVSPSGDVKCAFCDRWFNIHQ